MANTPNFNLYKPDRADTTVDVDTSLTTNFTTIDTELKNNKDGLDTHKTDVNAHASDKITHADGSVKTTLDNHEERIVVAEMDIFNLDSRVDDLEVNGTGGGAIPPDLENRLTTVESDVEGILAPATFDAMNQQSYTFDEYRIGYVNNKLGDVSQILLPGVTNAVGGINELISQSTDHATQLAEITKNTLNKMDVFTTIDGVARLDGTKVSAILNDPSNGIKTFYLKSGSYSLVNPITVTSEISLYMEDDTIITAYQAMDYMFYYSLGAGSQGGNAKKKIIRGGKWDGNGLATKCLHFNITANVTLRGMQISNPVAYGLYVEAGYELIANNLLFHNNLTTNIETVVSGATIGCTAMYINTFDGVYDDITIVNYTTGIECKKNGNYYNNVHMWGNQLTRLASTYNIGIIDRSGYNFFDKIYFDTFNLGYYASSAITAGNSRLTNCMFNYADNYHVEGKTPVYISNQSTKPIVFRDCEFNYVQVGGSTNTAQISTGNIDLIQYRDCDFATPTTLTNVPTNRANYAPKIYKFKFTYSGIGNILANNSYVLTKDLTASPYNFTGLSYEDTAVINTSLPSQGLIPYITLIDNQVYLKLYNATASTINVTSNFTVWVTIIKNYDKAIIPYIS